MKKAVSKVKSRVKKVKSKIQSKRNMKKINKMAIKAEKKKKGSGLKKVTIAKKANPSKIKATGKIRKGMKAVKMTEGGAYAKYSKKSKAAKSFRSAFAAAKKKGQKTFTWDGRKYSTKTK